MTFHNGHPIVSNEERFWSFVKKTKACWLWTGSACKGYGQFREHIGPKKNKMRKAHRFSWTLHKGPVPKGMKVMHKCDVGICVRPKHLFLGTLSDNMQDMLRKGRGPDYRGHRNPRFGKPVSVATRKRMSQSQLGRKHSRATLHKMSIAQKRRFANARAIQC